MAKLSTIDQNYTLDKSGNLYPLLPLFLPVSGKIWQNLAKNLAKNRQNPAKIWQNLAKKWQKLPVFLPLFATFCHFFARFS